MMTTTPKAAIAASHQATPECCMCGDCGLSHELFQCRICHFRSQHRYCSNLYPKAESYQVCNWCLSHESKEKSQNCSTSSSLNKNSSEDDSKDSQNKKKKKKNSNNNNITSEEGGRLRTHHHQRGNLQLQVINSPIKKQTSPERSSQTITRRRLISNSRLEEIKLIRRTKSEEISNKNNNNNNNNGITTRHVFRNKVRRYKLLDEVSS